MSLAPTMLMDGWATDELMNMKGKKKQDGIPELGSRSETEQCHQGVSLEEQFLWSDGRKSQITVGWGDLEDGVQIPRV